MDDSANLVVHRFKIMATEHQKSVYLRGNNEEQEKRFSPAENASIANTTHELL